MNLLDFATINLSSMFMLFRCYHFNIIKFLDIELMVFCIEKLQNITLNQRYSYKKS